MTISTDFLTDPFTQYAFMRRALAACAVLALGGTPLGVLMVLRRLTLVGDAMSHAILPGVALAFVSFGLAVGPMTFGGLLTGILVALLVVALTRYTQLKEDASFTLVYLLSLAGGVVIVSQKGNSVDLLHLLFGNILAIDDASLYLVSIVAAITLLVLAAQYRGLVIECFDPDFAKAARRGGNYASQIFFLLLVINLIAAFQALGTLMALGLMILPALAARFWSRNIDKVMPLSIGFALLSAYIGLLFSYYHQVPAGPAVVLTAGGCCVASLLLGRFGSVYAYIRNLD